MQNDMTLDLYLLFYRIAKDTAFGNGTDADLRHIFHRKLVEVLNDCFIDPNIHHIVYEMFVNGAEKLAKTCRVDGCTKVNAAEFVHRMRLLLTIQPCRLLPPEAVSAYERMLLSDLDEARTDRSVVHLAVSSAIAVSYLLRLNNLRHPNSNREFFTLYGAGITYREEPAPGVRCTAVLSRVSDTAPAPLRINTLFECGSSWIRYEVSAGGNMTITSSGPDALDVFSYGKAGAVSPLPNLADIRKLLNLREFTLKENGVVKEMDRRAGS